MANFKTFKENLTLSLNSKLLERLETLQVEMAEGLYSGKTERIDELKASTLGSYIEKATSSRKKAGEEEDMAIDDYNAAGNDGDRSYARIKAKESYQTYRKRNSGLNNALNKLRNGEFQKEDYELYEAKEPSFHNKLKAHYKEKIDSIEDPSILGKDGDGNSLIRNSFYYTKGLTSKDHAKKVSDELNGAGINHEIVDHGTIDKPFRGGANTKQSSHWWVAVKPKAQ